MECKFLKSIKSETKMFYIFLFVHLIIWSTIGLIRTVMPTDSLEGVYWGYFHDFGTPKHPPLAGWLTYLAYIPFKIIRAALRSKAALYFVISNIV